jgi:hypothetical protein
LVPLQVSSNSGRPAVIAGGTVRVDSFRTRFIADSSRHQGSLAALSDEDRDEPSIAELEMISSERGIFLAADRTTRSKLEA